MEGNRKRIKLNPKEVKLRRYKYCPHCEEEISFSLFYEHKRLYCHKSGWQLKYPGRKNMFQSLMKVQETNQDATLSSGPPGILIIYS